MRYIKWYRVQAKIGTWNVRYLCGKEEEIVEEMIRYKVDILTITETKKKENKV